MLNNEELDKVAFRRFRFMKPKSSKGKGSYSNRSDAYTGVDPKGVKFKSNKEIKKDDFQANKSSGAGMTADVGLWALGKVPRVGPQWKENASNFIARSKIKAKEFDAKATGAVKSALGVKKGGAIDKFTSKEHRIPVAKTSDGGTLETSRSIDSSLAPIKHVSGFAMPILGTSYLMDKMVPEEPNESPPPSNDLQPLEGEHYYDEEQLARSISKGLEKEAAMEKVSKLEEEVTHLSDLVKVAKYEREVLMNDSLRYQDELDFYKRSYEEANSKLEKVSNQYNTKISEIEKTEREEKVARITKNLLERGIIKQAKFNEYQDKLLNGGNDLIEAFEKMSSDLDKGLEKTLYLDENVFKQELPSKENIGKISSSGQTISEAVFDLLKK